MFLPSSRRKRFSCLFVLCLIAFRLLLDLTYVFFVSKVFYGGGFYLNLNAIDYGLSLLIFILLAFAIPYFLHKPSDFFITLFFLFSFVPLSSYHGMTGAGLEVLLLNALVLLSLRLSQSGIFKTYRLRHLRVPYLKEGALFVVWGAIIFVFALVAWYFYSGAFVFFNLNLKDVYEYRADSSAAARIGLLSYIINWVFNSFTLFLISLFLWKKKYLAVILFVAIQVFFFGVSSHKSVLFSPFLVIGVWFLFKNKRSLYVLPLSLLSIVFFSIVLYASYGYIFLGSVFVRRILYVPAYLSYKYFDFFSENEYVFWSNGIFSSFLTDGYDKPLGQVVGDFIGTGVYANNGFVASGYAHAGLLGLCIYTFFVVLILRLLDALVLKYRAPVWFVVSCTVYPIFSIFLSSDLVVSLISHGLFVSILVTYFYITSIMNVSRIHNSSIVLR